jgi:hypothetical protein
VRQSTLPACRDFTGLTACLTFPFIEEFNR